MVSKYFKFVGYLELVLWFIGLIAFIIFIVSNSYPQTIGSGNYKVEIPPLIDSASQWFFYIMLLIIYIVVGPAIGILFIVVANMKEMPVRSYRPVPQVNNHAASVSSTSVSLASSVKPSPKEPVKSISNSDCEKEYKKANDFLRQRKYDEAQEIFIKLGSYKDSKSLANSCESLKNWHNM